MDHPSLFNGFNLHLRLPHDLFEGLDLDEDENTLGGIHEFKERALLLIDSMYGFFE